MTKKDITEKIKILWQKLNSDISKHEKIKFHSELSTLIFDNLQFELRHRNVFIESCKMVLDEFEMNFKMDLTYLDSSPSNINYFLLAVNNSNLPD